MSAPFHIATAAFEPLPDNSGLGTSAFYYSLVLVLIAFIGASLVGPLVDGALGFIPSEIGPLVARRPYTAVSRRRTFLAKVAILAAAAPLAALAAQVVAAAFGISVASPVALWLFATAVIAAVGTSALAIFAALGTGIGSLVNTLFFVALAMVSSGGTVPLEAAPSFFRWVSEFAPFRHVIDGTRSLFYFDGNLSAGLGDAWVSVGIGGAIGIAAGLIVTTLYAKVPAFSRHPRAVPHA
jgi:ABC-type multidrug transport system permease subunit